MRSDTISRRSFLATAGPLMAGMVQTSKTSGGGLPSPGRPLRLGGPVFERSDDPALLARAHREAGYRAAYAPDVKLSDAERIKAIVQEFSAQDVVIAEVGAWVNMLDPDPDTRRRNLAFVTERLALAEALGARCCVNIAGSLSREHWDGPHPDNLGKEFFEATVHNVREVVDEVKPRRTVFSIEMMGWILPTGPDEYLELLRAVDRNSFGVHLDPCNIINSPQRFYRNADLIRECFEKLGPHIVSCHAKDIYWVKESQLHFREVIPGQGKMDYRAYLEGLAGLPAEVPLMLEHLKTPGEYAEGANYIRGIAREIGIEML